MPKNKSVEESTMEPKFSKEALLNAKRFRKDRDLVSAVLEDGVEYTISEVEEKIEKFLKGKVN